MTKHDFSRTTVWSFYEPVTGSLQYLLADKASGKAAIIDPVLDYDRQAGATATASADAILDCARAEGLRSEEHTSELQSLMRISYAVFCLKKKKQQQNTTTQYNVSNMSTHTNYEST